MGRTQHNLLKQRRASQAAMLVAAAAVPNTFQKTLMPRKTIDQGGITGATMAIDYLLISTIRKFIEDAADGMAGTQYAKDKDFNAHRRQRQFALFLDLAVLAASTYGQKRYEQKAQDPDVKAILRTGSTWLKYAAIAGLSVAGLDTLFGGPTKDGKRPARYKTPWGLIGGTLFAGFYEYRRRQSLKKEPTAAESSVNAVQAVAMGAGVLSVLAAIDTGEKLFAEVFSKELNKALPGSEDFFWSVGHSTALTGTALGVISVIRHVYHNIEEVATQIEPAYLTPPDSSLISGGPNSLVKWGSLSVQGRRFVSGAVSPGEIRAVMGGNQVQEPIRIYAGIDSASTEEKRLKLVLDELNRTKAFNREVILLASPTGTGYVNYVAVEAAELMSRGNIATAALQYSKRPSPMSLDRVPEGNLQFRMLVKTVAGQIAKQSLQRRPKLVVFGESLGAWTSQDAFINQGTDGLQNAGIDAGLWIGTPYGSKWKNQVLDASRPDVDTNLVGKFDNIKNLHRLSARQKQQLKYVMLTHDNDPVALFNLGLLIREPQWLKNPAKRPATVSRSQYYTSPGTFLLTLIDMANAMNVVPGEFEASGHDYRADLPEFVRHSFGFSVNARQMAKIETFLRANEIKRARRLEITKPVEQKGGVS